MTSAMLKKRIISLLDRRSDPHLLNQIHDMLANESSASAMKERMVAAVQAGEGDITEGRSMSLALFEKRIKSSLRAKIALRAPGRKRA